MNFYSNRSYQHNYQAHYISTTKYFLAGEGVKNCHSNFDILKWLLCAYIVVCGGREKTFFSLYFDAFLNGQTKPEPR